MFDKNRVHFMNAYYKATEKPYGYLLVDNKPGTPPDNQILADLFGEYKTKVIPNKVCIIRLYTIKYCIFRVNRLIFSRNFTSMALTISAYYLN